MPDTDKEAAALRLEPEESPSPDISAYRIMLGKIGIGEASFYLSQDRKAANIEWMNIKPEEQRKKYGTQAFAMLMQSLLTGHKSVDFIEAQTPEIGSMKIIGRYDLPAGWTKLYALQPRVQGSGDGEYYEPADLLTDNLDEALDCIEQGGSVTVLMGRSDT